MSREDLNRLGVLKSHFKLLQCSTLTQNKYFPELTTARGTNNL